MQAFGLVSALGKRPSRIGAPQPTSRRRTFQESTEREPEERPPDFDGLRSGHATLRRAARKQPHRPPQALEWPARWRPHPTGHGDLIQDRDDSGVRPESGPVQANLRCKRLALPGAERSSRRSQSPRLRAWSGAISTYRRPEGLRRAGWAPRIIACWPDVKSPHRPQAGNRPGERRRGPRPLRSHGPRTTGWEDVSG